MNWWHLRSLSVRAVRLPALVVGLGVVFGFALAQSQSGPALVAEDLIEAYERGDLSHEELTELLELLESRVARDSQQVANAQARLEGAGVAVAVETAAVGSREAWLQVDYQTLIAVRGRTYPREALGIRIDSEHGDLSLELGRYAQGEWQAQRAHAELRAGRMGLRVGSLQPRWTGGLLLGPAPRFVESPESLWESILQPRYARLVGAEAAWLGSQSRLWVIYSSMSDPELRHRVYGVRAQQRFGRVSVEPAVVHQQLQESLHAGQFEQTYGGLSALYRSYRLRGEVDVAVSPEAWAAQSLISGRNDDHVRWRVELWLIPAAFRNPLLYARAETDREPVDYPELELSLPSTSTGERGGELQLVFGPGSRSTELRLTYWRELSQQSASLRARVVRRRLSRVGRWVISYYGQMRPDETGNRARHEGALQLEGRALWIGGRARLTDGYWSPFGDYGGRVQVGWQHLRRDLGRLAVSATWESYDLGQAGRAFWTLRFDQQVPVRTRGRLSLHLRWRSAYSTQPAALTLRLHTEVML